MTVKTLFFALGQFIEFNLGDVEVSKDTIEKLFREIIKNAKKEETIGESSECNSK